MFPSVNHNMLHVKQNCGFGKTFVVGAGITTTP